MSAPFTIISQTRSARTQSQMLQSNDQQQMSRQHRFTLARARTCALRQAKKIVQFFIELNPDAAAVVKLESQPRWNWRFRKTNCKFAFALLCAFAIIITAVSLVMNFKHDTRVFHSSAPVSTSERVEGIAPLRHLMHAAMHNTPELCGIAAANFGVFKAFVMLRLQEGACNAQGCNRHVREMFEMKFDAPKYMTNGHTNRQMKHQELSLMCTHEQESVKRRWVEIDATYQDATGKSITKRLVGLPSMCFQHFWDVVNGVWPCPHAQDSMRIPVVFDSRPPTQPLRL